MPGPQGSDPVVPGEVAEDQAGDAGELPEGVDGGAFDGEAARVLGEVVDAPDTFCDLLRRTGMRWTG